MPGALAVVDFHAVEVVGNAAHDRLGRPIRQNELPIAQQKEGLQAPAKEAVDADALRFAGKFRLHKLDGVGSAPEVSPLDAGGAARCLLVPAREPARELEADGLGVGRDDGDHGVVGRPAAKGARHRKEKRARQPP